MSISTWPTSTENEHVKAESNVDRETHILTLNSGSSSLKFGLYRVSSSCMDCIVTGEAERIGDDASIFHAVDAGGRTLARDTSALASQRVAVTRIGELLAQSQVPSPNAIGHRIVHGGVRLREHCVIDESVLRHLDVAKSFAPIHTPAALDVIRFAIDHFPGKPQVACFDTSFHARMPPLASTLPLPRALRIAGIQRYGFHGLSCESIVKQLRDALPVRLLIAHLGNGASITAVHQGVSIDTSMGLTPTGGLIMGTRSGNLDPGVLVHLMREMTMGPDAIEQLVDHDSGLLGISGVSGDMRSLHKVASSNSDAKLAIAMFCYAAAKEMSAMSAALNGLDWIVFTGGIGENDALVRADICTRLRFFGVELDDARNNRGDGLISSDSSRCVVQVLPSQEDEQIARHTWTLCANAT